MVAVDTDATGKVQCTGYEAAKIEGVDLTKANIIVSAGRGVGKPENVAMVQVLAKALGGEYGELAGRWSTPAGWSTAARSALPAIRSRRDSTWPAVFPAPSSTWPV